MAIPAFVGENSTLNFSSTISVNVPEEASAGQTLVFWLTFATSSAAPSPSTPSGLTAHPEFTGANTQSSGRCFGYTATVTSGGALDPGDPVVFTFDQNRSATLSCVAYEASDVLAVAANMSTSTVAASVSTPTASAPGECRVVHCYGVIANGTGEASAITWTPDAATTQRSQTSVTPSTGREATQLVADESMVSAGTTTARTASASLTVQGQSAVFLLGTTVAQPIANAGPDQNVAAGATVNLDGSATDGGGAGAPYTYQWTQTSGTTVTLNDDTAENPSFTAPGATDTLVFSLVVTDTGSVASAADTVTINVAGPEDAVVPVGDQTVAGWTTTPSGDVFEVLADNNDSTYAVSSEDPTSLPLRVHLGAMNTPAGTDTVTLSARVRRQNASSGSATLQLVEGASTVIATTTQAIPAGDGFSFVNLVLSQGEIESVTPAAWAGDNITSDLDANLIVTAAA